MTLGRGTLVVAALLPAAAATSCSPSTPSERIERNASAIVGGRPSGDDENAAVFLVTSSDAGVANCSGRVVAPRLVLTARHCLLKDKSRDLHCSPDGEPLDSTANSDQTLEPAEDVRVFVGSDRTTARGIAVRDMLTTLTFSICRSDIAFLVLAEDALPVRVPIRRKPLLVGDELVISGWGFTADGQTALPIHRSTLDALPVRDVGPGFIPAGTFSTDGPSLCFGDSGSVALHNGAVVGTYSRIDGNSCELSTRQICTAIWTETDLVDRAFAAVGETPWYEDDSPADAGACDGGCEDTAPPPAAAAPAETSSCAASPRRGSNGGLFALVIATIAWARRRLVVASRQRPS